MKISLDNNSATYSIRAYEHGKITINEQSISKSVIVMPDKLILDWQPQSLEQLSIENMQILADIGAEIILLGTGAKLQFPEPAMVAAAMGHKRFSLDDDASNLIAPIGVEIMDTAAACRTFNVLSSEGRNVAAALLMM
jgi:uncharacterized protein